MRRDALRPGDLVRSRYRARWIGRVIALEELRDGTPVVRVQPILTRDGRAQGKHVQARTLSPGWLEFLERPR
jgi:hypothetical protein